MKRWLFSLVLLYSFSIFIRADVDLFNGLLVYYNFDGAIGGSVADQSGNGHDAVVQGQPESVPGAVGNAFNLDNGDFVRVNSNPTQNLTALTVSMWFKTENPSNNYKLASAASWAFGGDGSGWIVGTHYPELWSDEASNSIRLSGNWNRSVQFVANEWNHVVVIYDGAKIKEYVNGFLAKSSQATGAPLGAGLPLEVGNWSQYGGFNLQGAVDEFRVYNRALNLDELNALYVQGSPLIVHYTFDEDEGAVVTDQSGHGNHGSVIGAPSVVPGVANNAFYFNGSSSVQAASNPTSGFQEITVSLWFQTENPGNNYKLASAASWYPGGDGSGWIVGTHYPELWSDAPSNSIRTEGDWTRSVSFLANGWNHVVLTYDGNRIKEFINGQLAKDAPSSGEVLGTGMPLAVANWPQYGGFIFQGSIDDFRVYSRALQDDEVIALYRSTSSLVLYYNFDNDEGSSVIDQSGHGNDGMVSGATFNTQGITSGAMSFDGIDDLISAARSESLNVGDQITLAAWFNAYSYDLQRPIIEWFDPVLFTGVHMWVHTWGYQWNGLGTGANLVDTTGDEVANVISVADPTINQWHHLVVTYDGFSGTARLYLNGTLREESDLGFFIPLTSYDVIIGDRPSQADAQWHGLLDEVQIYNRVLNTEEVANLYQSSADGLIKIVLEDFQDGNFWSPETTLGWWDSDGNSVYQHSLETDPSFVGGKAMRVAFNKQDKPWSVFAGYLSSENTNRDCSQFNTVRVWAKGDTRLLFKLSDQNYNEQDVGVQKIPATDEILPMDFNYSDVSVDTSNIQNMLFFAAPGEQNVSGEFYINSMELVNTVKIEDFEDYNFWSPETTLGWWDIDGTTVYQRSFVSDPVREGNACMRVNYNKSGLPWSLFAGYLSGSNGHKDFSGYKKVSFWLYGDVDILVKLRDRSYNEQDVATVSGEAGKWSFVEVDYSSTTVNQNDIDNILFFAAPGDASAQGTFYIDDIKLTE